MMTKVELAKMIGLTCDSKYLKVNKREIEDLLQHEWGSVEQAFCNGKIRVCVQQKDLAKDKLDIRPEDLIKDEDAKVCCTQIETLLWERAAEDYLQKIHNAAMMLG